MFLTFLFPKEFKHFANLSLNTLQIYFDYFMLFLSMIFLILK
jgi:hypothetical protein